MVIFVLYISFKCSHDDKLYLKVDIPVASDAVQSLIESSTGALDHGWEVGWSLSSYSNDAQPLLNSLQKQVCGTLSQSFFSLSVATYMYLQVFM